jgi:SAM-dependent methyltransferase
MGECCGAPTPGFDRVFDDRAARDDLDGYHRDGPAWSSRALIDGLLAGGSLDGETVLDIGAGVGVVHLELLERGAATAVDVDGSAAYISAAREEAARRGLAERVAYRLGDVTAMGGALQPADLVALDRVVCCYPDVDALLTTAAGLATRSLGLVYPRDSWWIRFGAAVVNPLMSRRWGGYRMFIHRRDRIAGLLERSGLERRIDHTGRLWCVEVWDRTAAVGA